MHTRLYCEAGNDFVGEVMSNGMQLTIAITACVIQSSVISVLSCLVYRTPSLHTHMLVCLLSVVHDVMI